MTAAVLHTFASVRLLVAPLGLPPIGHPGDLRAHAARLRAIADQLAPAQVLLRAVAGLPGSEGPAADHARGRLQHESAILDQRADAIRGLAAFLERQATTLERDQHAWNSALAARTAAVPAMLVNDVLAVLGWRRP